MSLLSGDTANRLAAALTHPGAAAEVVNQLTNPTFTTQTVTSLQYESVTDAIAAHAGGGQGSATPLTAMINRVTTVASAGDSVVLMKAVPGLVITVINANVTNSMNVFPASGDAINALAANTQLAVAATKVCNFYCTVAGTWHSQVGA